MGDMTLADEVRAWRQTKTIIQSGGEQDTIVTVVEDGRPVDYLVLRSALASYMEKQHIRQWNPDIHSFGFAKRLKNALHHMNHVRGESYTAQTPEDTFYLQGENIVSYK